MGLPQTSKRPCVPHCLPDDVLGCHALRAGGPQYHWLAALQDSLRLLILWYQSCIVNKCLTQVQCVGSRWSCRCSDSAAGFLPAVQAFDRARKASRSAAIVSSYYPAPLQSYIQAPNPVDHFTRMGWPWVTALLQGKPSLAATRWNVAGTVSCLCICHFCMRPQLGLPDVNPADARGC